MRIRNVLKHRLTQVLQDRPSLTDTEGSNLFVVPDDDDLPAQIKRDKRIEVGLAGLVYDHYVETRRPRIEALGHDRDRHDPDRHRVGASLHKLARFGQERLPLVELPG